MAAAGGSSRSDKQVAVRRRQSVGMLRRVVNAMRGMLDLLATIEWDSFKVVQKRAGFHTLKVGKAG